MQHSDSPPGPSDWQELPSPLLASILVLAGPETRPAICLTCRRWRQLLLDEPAVWRSLRIRGGPPTPDQREQWAAATRALLQRHGGGLGCLAVTDCAALKAAAGAAQQVPAAQPPVSPSLSDLLALLPPGHLTRLSLEWGPLLPPEALQPLSRFARLECLEVEAAQVPPATALGLAHLTRLAALRCRVGRVTDSLLGALLALPHLERLSLEAPRMHPLVGPSLTLVTSLQELRLCSSQLPGDLCDQLATLQRLTRLELDAAESPLPPLGMLATLRALRVLGLHDRGGCNYGSLTHVPEPAMFPALQRYRCARACGWLQVGGARMRACAYRPADAHGTGPAALHIIDLRPGAPTLCQLVDALLPAGASAAWLRLTGGGPLPGCGGALAGLRELEIDGCSPGASGWDAFLAELLPAAPQLTRLCFAPAGGSSGAGPATNWDSSGGGSSSTSCSQCGSLPPALVTSPGQLRRLELRGTQLAAVPAGPYLACLRGLVLGAGALGAPQLPLSALAAATALTHLALEDAAELDEDAEAALWAALPQLEWLQLGAGDTAAGGAFCTDERGVAGELSGGLVVGHL